MSASASRTRSLLLIGAFAIIYIGWGTTYLANHFLLLEVPPFVIGSLRFSIAGLLALAWVLLSGQLRIQRSDWGGVLIGSLALIAVGQGALIYANQYLPTGMLAMLYTTLPLWSVALEWLLGERPPLWVMCGLALACGGIVLLMSNSLGDEASTAQWFAGSLVVLATLLWACGAWLLRQRPPFSSSWRGLSLQMLIGATLLALFGLWHGDWQHLPTTNLSREAWLWLLYLVLPVSLGVYPAYFWLLREVPASLPRVDFFHWLLLDIPAATTEIAAGAQSDGVTPRGKSGPAAPGGLRHGINDYTGWFAGDEQMKGDYYGYDGPCPPWNDSIVHHYVFTVYALATPTLAVSGELTGANVRAALQAGQVLGKASITGLYSLNPAVCAA